LSYNFQSLLLSSCVREELFGEVTKKLMKKGVPYVCPINLLPKHTERRLEALSTVLEWVQKPQDNFITRLTIEAIINNGIAKVPGCKGRSKTAAGLGAE